MITYQKILVIGIDQAIPYFIIRFAEEKYTLNTNYLVENEIFLFII